MTFVRRSLKLGRYGFTTLTVLVALGALYHWLQAFMAWGASSWSTAMAWSVLVVPFVVCVMAIEYVENRGD